jgi:hypothetical protein
MDEINKQLARMSDQDQKHYRYELSKLSESQRQAFEGFLVRMVNAGASKPFDWAWSEFREGIPQWARFNIIGGMYRAAHDVHGNAIAAEEFDGHAADIYRALVTALGEEKVNRFLKAYGKGMFYNVIDLFEGHPDYDHDASWQLVTYNRQTEAMGRSISGLHEDFLEFESEIEGLK